MATTTIQLSSGLKEELAAMKLHRRESYQEVLERLLEDVRGLDSKTRRELAKAEAEIARGASLTHRDLGVKLGF